MEDERYEQAPMVNINAIEYEKKIIESIKRQNERAQVFVTKDSGKRKEFEKAFEYFRIATQIKPYSDKYRYNLALAYFDFSLSFE